LPGALLMCAGITGIRTRKGAGRACEPRRPSAPREDLRIREAETRISPALRQIIPSPLPGALFMCAGIPGIRTRKGAGRACEHRRPSANPSRSRTRRIFRERDGSKGLSDRNVRERDGSFANATVPEPFSATEPERWAKSFVHYWNLNDGSGHLFMVSRDAVDSNPQGAGRACCRRCSRGRCRLASEKPSDL